MRAGVINFENLCACGNYKSADARCCQECLDRVRELRADTKEQCASLPLAYCECGNPMDIRATRCRECDTKRKKAAAKYTWRKVRSGNIRIAVCPECGGSMTYRAKMCKACYMKARS